MPDTANGTSPPTLAHARPEPPPVPTEHRDPPSAQRVRLAETVVLAVLGLLLAAPLRGHFAKPHGDFFELRECGVALLRGELPPTLKRAPVYPLLVAGGGALCRAAGVTDPPPEQYFAEWLGVALLPVNAVLIYGLTRRWCAALVRRSPGAARWWSVVFLLLPVGLYCTAHVLLEPLLVTLLLATLLAAGSQRPGPAYALAALATLTRFDVAGLVPGLALADLRAGRPRRRVLLLSGAALLPPAVWLGLTAATWPTRAEEHYLRQMARRPTCDPAGAVDVVLDAAFDPPRLRLPVWILLDEAWLRSAARTLLGAAAAGGLAVLVWRRERSATAAAVAGVAYLAVHALFPFRFPRFGYPPVAVLLPAAAAGAAAFWHTLSGRATTRPLRTGLCVLLTLAGLLVALGEYDALAVSPKDSTWPLAALVCVAVAAIALSLTPRAARPAWLAQVAIALGVLLLARVQLREAGAQLNEGYDTRPLVAAARWIAAHTAPDDGVVTDQPGLLRLYAPDAPRARFLSYAEVRADDWPGATAELRERGVRYLIWHEHVADEVAHAHDARPWRLERFAPLAAPAACPDVEIAWSSARGPRTWVLRLRPTADEP